MTHGRRRFGVLVLAPKRGGEPPDASIGKIARFPEGEILACGEQRAAGLLGKGECFRNEGERQPLLGCIDRVASKGVPG